MCAMEVGEQVGFGWKIGFESNAGIDLSYGLHVNYDVFGETTTDPGSLRYGARSSVEGYGTSYRLVKTEPETKALEHKAGVRTFFGPLLAFLRIPYTIQISPGFAIDTRWTMQDSQPASREILSRFEVQVDLRYKGLTLLLNIDHVGRLIASLGLSIDL